MIVTLKLSDELYQKYVEHNPTNPRLALEQTLERFSEIPPKERVLVFSPEVRKGLETLFGVPIEDPAKFLEWVKDRLSARIGDAQISLSDGIFKAWTAEAKHYGQEVREVIEKKVRRAIEREYGSF